MIPLRTCDKMKQDHQDFLNLIRLPGTIDAEQTGFLLGISSVHVSILVSKGFLKPLGRTLAANAPRRFSSAAISKMALDEAEMNRMQQILSGYWRVRNGTDSRPSKSSKQQNALNRVTSSTSN